MTDIKQQAAEYLALAEMATPGKWFEHGDTVWAQPDSDDEVSTCVAQECSTENAYFIAASREAPDIIRALLSENEALRAQLPADSDLPAMWERADLEGGETDQPSLSDLQSELDLSDAAQIANIAYNAGRLAAKAEIRKILGVRE